MKRIIVIAVVSLVALTGCGMGDKVKEPYRDAARSGAQNSDPADTITMPDGFTNIATKCDHGNRIYVSFHGDGPYASIAVVPQDPTCTR
jgi:major membrane immunogen (membrane-anchored lipoprotein)